MATRNRKYATSEEYVDPSRISTMEPFAKIVIDVWLGSKYASDNDKTTVEYYRQKQSGGALIEHFRWLLLYWKFFLIV